MRTLFVHKRKFKNGDKRDGLSGLCSTALAVKLELPIFTPKIRPVKDKSFIIINWGLTKIPWLSNNTGSKVINHPDSIRNAVDKKIAFRMMNGKVNIPDWTTDRKVAESWFDKDGKAVVFCRTLSKSYQGKGIVIATSKEELVQAPLYTLRVPKKYEYRVHIVNNKPVHIQQKKRLSKEKLEERGLSLESNGLVRCWNNGYIYSTNIVLPEKEDILNSIIEQSKKAIEALDLNFGAVDVIASNKGRITVLEVNTAPGIENSTIDRYASAFAELIKEVENEEK